MRKRFAPACGGPHGFGTEILLAQMMMMMAVSSSMANLLLPGAAGPAATIRGGAPQQQESACGEKGYGVSDILTATAETQVMSVPASDVETRISRAYRAHFHLLRAVATQKYRVPDDDVAELVQDVFVSFVRHHARIRNERAWLVGAVCNASRDFWERRSAAGISLPPDDLMPAAGGAEIDRIDVAAVLAQLSSRCASVLRLRYLEGWSTEEIARRFATSVNNAKQIVHRCKANARALYTGRRGER